MLVNQTCQNAYLVRVERRDGALRVLALSRCSGVGSHSGHVLGPGERFKSGERFGAGQV